MHVVECRLLPDKVAVQRRRSDAVRRQRLEYGRHLRAEDGEVARGDGAIRTHDLNIDWRSIDERGSDGPTVQGHRPWDQHDRNLRDCARRPPGKSEGTEQHCGMDRHRLWCGWSHRLASA